MEENDMTRRIERIAVELGVDVTCRLMHREGFEDQGEWFPPYDEYETRARGGWLCMDPESLVQAAKIDLDEFIRLNLEGFFARLPP